MSPPANYPLEDPRPCFFQYVIFIARVCGAATVVILWACTIHTWLKIDGFFHLKLFLTIMSFLVTLVEVAWAIDKCTCCRVEGCCCRVWKIIVWIDDWKKGILYFVLAIPCMLEVIVFAIISGCCLIISGFLYILKSFRYSKCFYPDPTHVSLVGTETRTEYTSERQNDSPIKVEKPETNGDNQEKTEESDIIKPKNDS